MPSSGIELLQKEKFELREGLTVQVRHEKPQSGERLYVQVQAADNATNSVFRVTDREQKLCKFVPRKGHDRPGHAEVQGVHELGWQIENVDVDIEAEMIGNHKIGILLDREMGDEEIYIAIPRTPNDMAIVIDSAEAIMEYWRRDSPIKDDPLTNKMVEMAQAYLAIAYQIYASETTREYLEGDGLDMRSEYQIDPTLKAAMKTAQKLHDKGLETTSTLNQAKRREKALSDVEAEPRFGNL